MPDYAFGRTEQDTLPVAPEDPHDMHPIPDESKTRDQLLAEVLILRDLLMRTRAKNRNQKQQLRQLNRAHIVKNNDIAALEDRVLGYQTKIGIITDDVTEFVSKVLGFEITRK